jgi:hypothetical protein
MKRAADAVMSTSAVKALARGKAKTRNFLLLEMRLRESEMIEFAGTYRRSLSFSRAKMLDEKPIPAIESYNAVMRIPTLRARRDCTLYVPARLCIEN